MAKCTIKYEFEKWFEDEFRLVDDPAPLKDKTDEELGMMIMEGALARTELARRRENGIRLDAALKGWFAQKGRPASRKRRKR